MANFASLYLKIEAIEYLSVYAFAISIFLRNNKTILGF